MTKIGWYVELHRCDGCKRRFTGRVYHVDKDRVCVLCFEALQRVEALR